VVLYGGHGAPEVMVADNARKSEEGAGRPRANGLVDGLLVDFTLGDEGHSVTLR
jgi:hypothetical protein